MSPSDGATPPAEPLQGRLTEIRALLRAGRLDGAEAALAGLDAARFGSAAVLKLWGTLRLSQQDWPAASRIYRQLVALFPADSAYLGRALAAEAMEATGRGDVRGAMEAAKASVDAAPDLAGFVARRMGLHLQQAALPPSETGAFFRELAALAPDDEMVRRLLQRNERLSAEPHEAAPPADASAAGGRWRGMSAFAAQDWRAAHRHLPRDADDPEVLRRVRLVDRLADIGGLEADPALARELYERGIVVRETPGAKVSVVAFGGVIGGRRLVVLDPFLRRLGTHAIFLSDRRNLVFADGVEQLGGTVEATAAALARLNASLGAQKVIALGQSAGGYAAVRYALMLEAHGALIFSSPTTFDADYLAMDGRGRAVFHRIRRRAGQLMIDLKPLLERQVPPLQLVCVHGEGMEKDRWHAERLRGVPGVALAALPGLEGHDSLVAALASGAFERMAGAFMAGADAQAAASLV